MAAAGHVSQYDGAYCVQPRPASLSPWQAVGDRPTLFTPTLLLIVPPMIHVVATITVHPGRRCDFLAEFRRMVPATRAEDGCLADDLLGDVPAGVHPAHVPTRPEVVTIVERWRDLDALRAHLVAPHMATYRARVKDLVARILTEPA